MSDSVNPTDTRAIFVQYPALSSDSETEKQKAVPTPTQPVKVVHAGAGYAPQKRDTK